MTTTDYRLPWLDTTGLETWLDTVHKGRHAAKTNAEWLRGNGPVRKGRDLDTGTYYVKGGVGFTYDVPVEVWDAANLRIIPDYAGHTVGPLTAAETAEVAAAWAGGRRGYDRDMAERELAEHRTMLDDLRANRITARRVTGKGTRKSDAVDYLTRGIHRYQDMLDTNGESDGTNRSNARHRARRDAA